MIVRDASVAAHGRPIGRPKGGVTDRAQPRFFPTSAAIRSAVGPTLLSAGLTTHATREHALRTRAWATFPIHVAKPSRHVSTRKVWSGQWAYLKCDFPSRPKDEARRWRAHTRAVELPERQHPRRRPLERLARRLHCSYRSERTADDQCKTVVAIGVASYVVCVGSASGHARDLESVPVAARTAFSACGASTFRLGSFEVAASMSTALGRV